MKLIFIYFFTLLTYLMIDYLFTGNLGNFLQNSIGVMQELLILFMILTLLLFIKYKRVVNYLIIFLLSIYFIVFVLQILSIQMTGEVLNLAAFANADEFMLLVNRTLIVKIAIFSIILILFIKIYRDLNYVGRFEILISILILFISYKGLLYYKHKDKDFITVMPFKNFFYKLKEFYTLNINEVYKISKDDILVAKRFNILIDTKKDRPFNKEYIYKRDLPFKKIKDLQPNVIILFVESLSARLLSPYNKSMKDITVNIDSFSKESMVVKGYYNHATPTAPALYGQHCSLYPVLTYYDFNKDINPLEDLELNCFPKIFNRANYNTVYLSHSRGIYSHIERNLELFGYKNVYLWTNLLKKFLPNESKILLGEKGLSDHQMMNGLKNYLKEYNSSKPFIIGLSTIETHIGFEPNPYDGLKYRDGKSNTLNMIYNFDNAFGIFWRYFKNSKYYKNTIVILTGDHALYPNVDYQKVTTKDWIPSVFDKLSLIIYDPIHKLPKVYYTNASSVDLAPTLIHLSNLDKREYNSFVGKSIFDKREYNSSFGISAYSDFNFYMDINGSVTNKKIDKVVDKKIIKYYKSLKKVMHYIFYLQKIHKF